jgi:hypothetical protein
MPTDSNGNGCRTFLRWWHVIATLTVWLVIALGSYFSLKTEINQSRIEREGQIKLLTLGQTELEKSRTEMMNAFDKRMSELNARAERIENKLDRLAERR